MTAVYGKELSAYFKNPQGYICLAVYYLLGGQFFLMHSSSNNKNKNKNNNSNNNNNNNNIRREPG